MRTTGSTTLTLPPFGGSTRKLVVVNIVVFFALGLLSWLSPPLLVRVVLALGLVPERFAHGMLWQPLTYCFVNTGLLNTAFGLLTLWFVASRLEEARGARWLVRLYYGAAFGGGTLAVLLTLLGRLLPPSLGGLSAGNGLYMGLFAPLFAILVAFAVLFGEVEFLFFFVIRLKAKYLVAIMALWRLGLLLWSREVFSATVELCCGFLAFLYVHGVPADYGRRTIASTWTERYFGWRNSYIRWKRRRAAKGFQVYMRKQNREVHFDNEGRYLSPEDERRRDPSDKRWMN